MRIVNCLRHKAGYLLIQMTEPKQVFHLSFESESELPMFAHLAVVGACHVNAWTSQFYRSVPDIENCDFLSNFLRFFAGKCSVM